tara:strand:- start:20856 stop:21317 length:462 start_codon:yes stop_codon:yes gene_type:complete
MSNEQINIRIVIDFLSSRQDTPRTRFFRYDENNDTFELFNFELRQLLLTNGSNVSVEVAFGDGHETRDAVGLMDVLGTARSTLYARREPTKDEEGSDGDMDIVLYRSQDATEPIARYPWHFVQTKPRYGDSIVVHNCATYYLIWLTDLQTEGE